MFPGTQSQDTSSYKTPRLDLEFEFRVTQASASEQVAADSKAPAAAESSGQAESSGADGTAAGTAAAADSSAADSSEHGVGQAANGTADGGDDDGSDGSSDEGEVFEVEAVLERGQDDDGVVQYLVRWKGFGPDDDTWEPEEGLKESAGKALPFASNLFESLSSLFGMPPSRENHCSTMHFLSPPKATESTVAFVLESGGNATERRCLLPAPPFPAAAPGVAIVDGDSMRSHRFLL